MHRRSGRSDLCTPQPGSGLQRRRAEPSAPAGQQRRTVAILRQQSTQADRQRQARRRVRAGFVVGRQAQEGARQVWRGGAGCARGRRGDRDAEPPCSVCHCHARQAACGGQGDLRTTMRSPGACSAAARAGTASGGRAHRAAREVARRVCCAGEREGLYAGSCEAGKAACHRQHQPASHRAGQVLPLATKRKARRSSCCWATAMGCSYETGWSQCTFQNQE